MTERAIIVFDGVCVLCNRWVRFLLKRDHHALYRFAAMQGETGRALLQQQGMDPDDPLSFLLIEDGCPHTDSDAVLRVLAGLGGGWRIIGLLRWVPRALRDPLYLWLARNRYRWFGRRDACLLPDAELRQRFLP